jgi:hypothetical protein
MEQDNLTGCVLAIFWTFNIIFPAAHCLSGSGTEGNSLLRYRQ